MKKLFFVIFTTTLFFATACAQQSNTIEGVPEWRSIRAIPEGRDYTGVGLVFFQPTSAGIEVEIKRSYKVKEGKETKVIERIEAVMVSKVSTSSSDLIAGDIDYSAFSQPLQLQKDGTPTNSYVRPIHVTIVQEMKRPYTLKGGDPMPTYRLIFDSVPQEKEELASN